MEYDKDRVDEYTLALFFLVMHDENEHGARAWKGFDWDTMNRLHDKRHPLIAARQRLSACQQRRHKRRQSPQEPFLHSCHSAVCSLPRR